MLFNELALEMTSVGSEMLNEIGKYSYDPIALVTINGVTMDNRDALRPAASFGTDAECDPTPASQFAGCIVINDFHNTTTTRSITRTHNGNTYTVDYNLSVEIRYVEEAAPFAPSANKTFAKEALVTVSTPVLVDGAGDPIEVVMSRVYLYPNYERGKPYSTF